MSESISFLKQLLEASGEYLEQHPQPDLTNFARWLLVKEEKYAPNSHQDYQTEGVDADNLMYLLKLHRFAKSYAKIAFENSPLRTVEEFTVLIHLWEKGSAGKAEVIRDMVLDLSVGAEVIKRVVKLGLITERQSEEDRRKRIISLTDEGRQTLLSVIEEVRKVAWIVNGQLGETEKQTLHFLLKTLSDFHWDVRYEQQHNSLDGILGENQIEIKAPDYGGQQLPTPEN